MNREQLLILKDEISQSEYSGMSDAEIVAAVNAKTIQQYRRVPMSEVVEWANGKRLFKRFSGADMLDGSLYRELDLLITGKQEAINFASEQTGVSGLIGDLVGAGILTMAEAGELQALGVETVAWTTANGLPELCVGYLTDARALEV